MIRRLPQLFLSCFWALPLLAQQPPPPNSSAAETPSTIHGCLQGERGNYLVVEDKTSFVYVLKGVGNKLDALLNHEVEVKGHMRYGTIKTGTRAEKAGSSPSDAVHSVDGVPFEVNNVQTDIHSIAKHCKAADSD
jgi:hypothetical protein